MNVLTKKSGIITIVVCWLLSGMLSFQAKAQTDTKLVTGHFANAKTSQTLILKVPTMNSTETGCDGGCVTQIKFSDLAVPAISIKDCIGGELTNLGDLNGDGLDEIGLLPGWFAGCWHNYRVYTFKHKRWHLAVPPFQTHCNEFEAEGVKPIVKDTAKPGHVVITYSAFSGNTIVFITRSEQVK